MAPSTFRASVAIGLVVAPLALLGIACSRAAEQQFLTQFFRAARARDNNTISMMSAVEFDPREQGEVVELRDHERQRGAADAARFQAADRGRAQGRGGPEGLPQRRKIEYQNANMAGARGRS